MRVDRLALYEALRELVRVTAPRAPLPILSEVLIYAAGDKLSLTATDLTQTLTCELCAHGDLTACLPVKLLADLTKVDRKRDGGEVSIEPLGKNQVTIQIGVAATRLTGFDPQSFPGRSDELDWSLLGLWPANELLKALRFVLPAASRDSTRRHLCGVYFDEGNLVATDGHRLHLAPLPAAVSSAMLVPASSAATITRLLLKGDHVILARTKDRVRVRVGGWQLETKLVDAVFPPYKHVIRDHDSQPIRVTAEITRIAQALKQLARLSENTKARVNGAIKLSASAIGPTEASLELVIPVIESNHLGDDLVIGFGNRYLMEAVVVERGTVQMGFAGSLDAVRVDLSGGRVAVIMPVRL